MEYCQECKSEDLMMGCNYCRESKTSYLILENKKLKAENKFLKNELELIDEQHNR
tara:strand:+ start:1100 stop:1264 length:165 start_codon:yes stop_codon:yes gene_type:complete